MDSSQYCKQSKFTPTDEFKVKLLFFKFQRKSNSAEVGGNLQIILGTSKGGLALYSYATAKIEVTFNGDGHSGAVTSIDHDNSKYIYTSGLDAKVFKWNIKNCHQETSFDCGPEKPTAICLLNNGELIATASKSIKIWNTGSVLLHTFTGHSSNVTSLRSFAYNDENYIISASKNDRNLSLWKFVEDDKKPGAAATLTLINSSPNCVDYSLEEDRLQVTCICRNELLAFFQTSLTSLKSKKPIKAKFTIEIASEGSSKVEQIPLGAVKIVKDELVIGYGDMLMKFEMVPTDQSQKNVILVRKDPLKLTTAKSKDNVDQALNLVTPISDKNAEILNAISAKRKINKSVEIPLEMRLDNMSVGQSKRPNAKKMTHQLIQGLHGQDSNILRNVLRQHDEETVQLTVKYLPAQYVMTLVNELSFLMSKKTEGSEIALMWLRQLIKTHASSLMAYGIDNLNATFGTTLGIIDHRTQNLPGLLRLKGRLELLVQQLEQSNEIEDTIHNANMLVYEDSGKLSVEVLCEITINFAFRRRFTRHGC